jgi:GT2 family glycosyltransferase
VLRDGEHRLFWSLSFALTARTWHETGGFCEDYTGYGGEDTDFALTAAARGVGLWWVGGAPAYHQHHPVSRPPVEHLDDILRNGALFRKRWGTWPMEGWLRGFAERGLVVHDRDTDTWRRTGNPEPLPR